MVVGLSRTLPLDLVAVHREDLEFFVVHTFFDGVLEVEQMHGALADAVVQSPRLVLQTPRSGLVQQSLNRIGRLYQDVVVLGACRRRVQCSESVQDRLFQVFHVETEFFLEFLSGQAGQIVVVESCHVARCEVDLDVHVVIDLSVVHDVRAVVVVVRDARAGRHTLVQLRFQMSGVMALVREWFFAGYTVPLGHLNDRANGNTFLFFVIMSLEIMMVAKRGFATVTDEISWHL